MSLKVAIYVRVSTEEQGLKDLSIPFQLDTCRVFAASKGWTVVVEYIDVSSAKTDRRENFQKLVADARTKLFDVVIV